MGGMEGEREDARGGEAGLGGDRVGRGIGNSESGQDVTGCERQGELWGRETELCEETFGEG